MALINQPNLWATISATESDRRSFVKMCLERSRSVPLEVMVKVDVSVPIHQLCTCKEDDHSRLVPNEDKPCEWHFVFEPLAETRHLERIRTLHICFSNGIHFEASHKPLGLRSCRFFKFSSVQITSLGWTSKEGWPDTLFPPLPFVPTLHSLSFGKRRWDDQIMKFNKLTSVAFKGLHEHIDAQNFRTFLLNNPSLEILLLKYIYFKGDPKGPPVILSNLRSLSVCLSKKILSTLLRAPALQRLSSLSIFAPETEGYGQFTFCATGEGIVLTVKEYFVSIKGTWKDFTGYTNPTIRHVILKNPREYKLGIFGNRNAVLFLLTDAETLEIDRGYTPKFYPGFWKDLRELGPQLRIIRFEDLGEINLFQAKGKAESSSTLSIIKRFTTHMRLRG